MPSRISLVSALAVSLSMLVVLLAALVLARPSAPTMTGSARATPASTSNSPGALGNPAANASGAASARPEASFGAAASATTAATDPPPPRPSGPPAPELAGGGAWINSEPLTLAGLRGKVVLVDFWTYGCYNCKNTLPYVRQWWDRYRDRGLVIVGVHTPEFESEKRLENVREAVRSEQIGWPVVQDNDKNIWRAYGNRYWPRFYLIDRQGRIIYDHIGEGAYDETERQIVEALAAARSS